jgi:HD superfamily phosphohydrolase
MYPSATQSRLEHSLGVLEMASRIFDVVTDSAHTAPEVGAMLPELSDKECLQYWRRVVRAAALCHDVGHLPFSHAAEAALLPPGWRHEQLTRSVILDDELGRDIDAMGLRSLDVAKVAVGPRAWPAATFSPWEKIMSQIIVSDAFGADRIDYLLRDPRHVGIRCPRFAPLALIAALRILPAASAGRDSEGSARASRQEPREPTLGILATGLPQVQALIRARRFMFSHIYYQHARCVYDIHLTDFLRAWLPGGKYPAAVAQHLAVDDCQVAQSCREVARSPRATGHDAARRLVHREPFKLLCRASFDPRKTTGRRGDAIYQAAARQFGAANVRHDSRTLQNGSLDFPVQMPAGRVVPSSAVCRPLAEQATTRMERLYVHPRLQSKARRWLGMHGSKLASTV